MPPLNVILALPDGQNKRYQIPKDQVFMIDGEKKTAFDLRPGMSVTATVVTQAPEVVSSEQRVVTGAAPPPPPPPATPPPQSVLLIEVPVPAPVAAAPPAAPAPAPAPQAAEPAPAQLPKTASPVPLAGLIGLLLVSASLGLRALRH
jgi:outer membrane biosynthesis protein TonB